MAEHTHWKSTTNPNYLGGYSLPEGQDLIVTIERVGVETVIGTNGKKERETVARLVGQKPLILNKTNMKTMEKLFGTPYIEEWRGRSMQLYFDPKVKFGREVTGGLRVRPFLPQQQVQRLICTDCGNTITAASGKDAQWVSKYTYQQYGAELCASCAASRKERMQAASAPNPLG